MNYGMFKHAFSAEELYAGLNKKLLRGRWVKNRYQDRKQLASNIFKDCFYEVLLDIINNNVTFVLPIKYGNYAEICMKQYSGEEFKKLYKWGKFSNIDFVLSQFTGNQLTFRYSTKNSGTKEKPIYVNKDLKKLIEKYSNEARQYY
jgi:hypothetical protein